jgi:GNAT superfamily N-acetyltransferase
MTFSKNHGVTITCVVDPAEEGLFDLLNGFLTTIGEPALEDESVNRLKEAIKKEKIFFYIARTAESVAGICSLTIGFSTYRAAPFGVMEDFYVVPEMRRRGVARLLLEYALADARKKGCRSLVLGCSDDDMPMYEHLGFRKIGNMMAQDLVPCDLG